ncbi:LamG-like jellyroll fold domain-containing protein, partial [Planctomycetota bacterium]
VSSGLDGTIDTWDAASGENVMTLRGHHGSIQSAAFSADGSRIISSGDDKTIKLWDIPSSPEQFFIQTPSPIRSIWFSPDGRRFATAGRTWAALTLWDAMTGVELLRLGNAHVWACAFSPNAKHIVLAEGNNVVKIWDAETGEQRTVLRGHDYRVSAVVYSPDGKYIASSSRKKIIKIWDTATGAELMKLEDEEARDIRSLTYSPDGSRLISCGGDNVIRVWDVASGKRVLAIKQEGQAGGGIAISPDGKRIASGGTGEIRIWDATNGRQLITLRGHNGNIRAVSFSPAADRFVSCSRADNTVKVWDTTTGLELMTLVGDAYADITDVAFSPDGSTIAAAGREGIILWETKEPMGGLGPRRNAQAARPLVQRLHQEHGAYHEVRDQLSGDDTLDEAIREMALQIVDTRMPPEACELAWNVLSTIVPFEKDTQEYQAALMKLEKANRLAPDEFIVLEALGAVQCRLGSYEDAIETLVKSAQMHSDLGNKFNPMGLAFRAMAEHKIGQTEEAKATLEQLRENLDMTGARWRWGIPIFEALLPELEELIEGGRRSFSDGELVAHWTFDEVTGGEVLDSTGKGLHGRLIGNAHIVSDMERGSVLRLPGKGDYVDCAWNSAFDITGAMTIAAWTKVTALDSSRWEEIVSTGNYGLGLQGHKEDPNCVRPCYWYNSKVWLETELDVDNQWHLMVVLYDGLDFAFYIDGKLGASKRLYQSVVMDTGPMYIGKTRKGNRNEGWNGLIDDVRIYSYALTADEAKDLYEGREPPRERR